eukprot:CAMPEP_0179154352 /NCGR_PEP_ID=MMETSP0796-20121207/75114_1 /TAXON_ID=73915 /ORGANISM="Pyrodinium bahamense, Strain pbaha01" /LENGTH=37 /DNA_ID= /DNA_START= /DNA_END= /DNA_ORIENTATION=
MSNYWHLSVNEAQRPHGPSNAARPQRRLPAASGKWLG